MRLYIAIAGLVLGWWVPGVTADQTKAAPGPTYQVPYRLTDTLHVLVRAKINGKGPFNFILDTGAPFLFIATSVGKELGLESDSEGWATLVSFEIEGGVVIPQARARIETPFQLEGMNGLGLAGATLHGIIGYNILARYRLEFDFSKEKLTWTRLDFEPPNPRGLRGKGGAPGGLDALGGVLKLLGGFLGKKAEPELVIRGFIGVETADGPEGVQIKSVIAGSPANKAGLRPGDRIERVQGKLVASQSELRKVAKFQPGDEVSFQILRGKDTQEVKVRAGNGM
jgi:membrane-associated protease RseP (regulator of RpoE activity)